MKHVRWSLSSGVEVDGRWRRCCTPVCLPTSSDCSGYVEAHTLQLRLLTLHMCRPYTPAERIRPYHQVAPTLLLAALSLPLQSLAPPAGRQRLQKSSRLRRIRPPEWDPLRDSESRRLHEETKMNNGVPGGDGRAWGDRWGREVGRDGGAVIENHKAATRARLPKLAAWPSIAVRC